MPSHATGGTDLPALVADDQRRVISVNTAALQLFAIGSEDIVGHRIDELVPEPGRSHVPSLWWALDTGGSLAGRLPVRAGDGRPLVVEFVSVTDPERRRYEVRMLPAAGPDDERRRSRERRALSGRELEVLALAARGGTGAQIAAQLHLSESTVESHVRRAVQALGAQNRVHAVALAIGRGLIEPPRA